MLFTTNIYYNKNLLDYKTKMWKRTVLALSAVGYLSVNNRSLAQVNFNDGDKSATTKNAICILYPDNNSGVTGVVSFQQEDFSAATKIVASVKGLSPNSLHAIHVHQYGDLTNGCVTAGPHYNPHSKNHGGPMDSERHVGDLGNLKSNEKGEAYMAMSDMQVKLHGEDSIAGRSVVVHAGEDDLGKGGHADSLTTGHAGARLACGTIGLSGQFKNLPPQ